MIGDLLKDIHKRIYGRVADEYNNIQYLMETVRDAGDGNYLEIGVLFGGTMVAAALTKKAYDLGGKCVGVDPLDGFYRIKFKRNNDVDAVTKKPVSPESVRKNFKIFDVEDICEIYQAYSYPLPDEVASETFAVTFIDGDHWGDVPLKDWNSVKDITTKFVIFDNYDKKHPEVMQACHIAENDPSWERYFQQGITFIVKRRDL
jgi:hypothetical protein